MSAVSDANKGNQFIWRNMLVMGVIGNCDCINIPQGWLHGTCIKWFWISHWRTNHRILQKMIWNQNHHHQIKTISNLNIESKRIDLKSGFEILWFEIVPITAYCILWLWEIIGSTLTVCIFNTNRSVSLGSEAASCSGLGYRYCIVILINFTCKPWISTSWTFSVYMYH